MSQFERKIPQPFEIRTWDQTHEWDDGWVAGIFVCGELLWTSEWFPIESDAYIVAKEHLIDVMKGTLNGN